VKFACHVHEVRPSVCSSRVDIISHVTRPGRLQREGRVLVAVLDAYLDESGTHDGSPLTCSAGYVFSHEGCAEFGKEWNAYLEIKGLDAFHATDLQGHPDAEEMFSRLRELTKRTSEKGFLRFILADEVASLKSRPELRQFIGGSYSLLTISCMRQMAHYAKSRGDTIWYFIEAREDSAEREFKTFIRLIEDSDDLKEQFAFHLASVIPKKNRKNDTPDGIQLQAADLASWSFSRAYKDMYIPGFKTSDDYVSWYIPSHSIGGYSEISYQGQAMANAFNGLRLP
jgi:hypothetical protein